MATNEDIYGQLIEVNRGMGELTGIIKSSASKLDNVCRTVEQHSARIVILEERHDQHDKTHETEICRSERALKSWQFVLGVIMMLIGVSSLLWNVVLKH